MPPVCPPNYICEFKPDPPEQVYENWWYGPGGNIIAGIALVVFAAIILLTIYWASCHLQEARKNKRIREREQWKLAMNEQLTMQMDMAKGNKEMYSLINETQNKISVNG